MKASNVSKMLKYFLVLLLLNAPLSLVGAGINLVSPSNFNLCVVEGEIECGWNYNNPTGLPLSNVAIYFYKDTTKLVVSEDLEDNAMSFSFNSFDFPEMLPRAAYKWEVVATIGSITYRATNYFYMIPKASYGLNSLEDGKNCVATKITLDWTPQEPEYDYFYEVQLSKNITFDVLVPVIVKPEYLTSADAELEYNTQYYWRLRGINCNNNYSEIRTFRTIQSAVTLKEPENFTTCATIKENDRVFTKLIWQSDVHLTGNYLLKVYDVASDKLIDSLLLVDKVYQFDITEFPNSEIKWRVQLIQNFGTDACISDWSETYYFYTPLEMPEIIYPINNKCLPLKNVEFRWKSNLLNDYYIQIAIYNSQNDSLVTLIDTINTGSYIIKNVLKYQHKYYYKIRLRTAELFGDDYIYSVWSDTAYFETTTSGPNLISPENNLFGVLGHIELVWQDIPNAESYILEVCSDINFNRPATQTTFYQDFILSDTRFGFPLQPTVIHYYWRVKARINSCESDYTEIRSFSSALKVPEIISPANKSVEKSNYVVIKWKALENTKYDIEYSKYKYAFDSLYSLVITNTFIVGNEFTIYSLDTNTTYYWRIKAKNDVASSAWSEIYEFKTGYEEPYKVELLSPLNTFPNILRYGNYRWKPTTHAEKYKIEFATKEDFSNSFNFVVTGDQTYLTLESNMFDNDLPPLSHNTKYYWRVCGINKTAIGGWSDAWSFTTCPKITNLMLLYPLNGDTNVSYDNARFNWTTAGARAYRLMLLDASDNVVLDTFVIDNSFGASKSLEVAYTKLQKNTNYKWKLFASEDGVAKDNNNGEEGAWSGTWLFKTVNPDGILDNSFISSISITPNPANNSATLMFYTKEIGSATMSIADITGNILLSDAISLDFGENLVSINTTSLPPGNYTLLLHINSKLVATSPFIIAR